MSEPLLKASALNFAYGRSPVLRDLDLQMSGGEVLVIIGPNGSGKSTLIKLVLGQLKSEPSRVFWEGKDVQSWKRRDLARQVAYLPQAPTADPEHRVVDVLRLGRAPYWSAFGIESERDGEVVKRIASELGLNELLTRRMDELSGGQRQRVFIGRCLVQEPAALVLDEPNTYLDIKHQMELASLLKNLARENNVGILLALHDLNLAGVIADRMILLHEGTVAAQGTANHVLRADILSSVYGVRMERSDRAGGGPLVVPVLTDPHIASDRERPPR
jgi:iron complex transport system ATP-binding protein